MIRYILKKCNNCKGMIAIFLTTSILLYALEILFPMVFSNFLDAFILEPNSALIKQTIYMIAPLAVIFLICTYGKEMYYTKAMQKMRYDTLNEIECHIEKIPLCKVETYTPAYLNERLNSDVISILMFMFTHFIEALLKGTTLIVLFYLIFRIHPHALVAVITVCLTNTLAGLYYHKMLFKKGYTYREANTIFYATNNERLSFIKQTKRQGWQAGMIKRVENAFESLYKACLSYTRISSAIKVSGASSKYIGLILVVAVGGQLVVTGEMSIGELVLLSTYTNLCIQQLTFFLSLSQNFQHANVSYVRLQELLSMPKETVGHQSLNAIDNIEIENLNYAFENDKNFYNGLTCTLKKGSIYALSGDNGSGKSTFLDILIGLRNEYTGRIAINQVDLRDIDTSALREKHIAFVEQEMMLLDITLKENVQFGLCHYSTEALENDMHYFGMKDIFSRESDTKVSGGEKQKISIIRACLKDSDLLILDEPNSALDKESTLLLKAKLKQLKSNKIILLITHNDQFDDIIDSVITI
ncbi:ATP-binding cassette domain-containing protein [Fusibacter sp. JL298sf-3]